MTVAKRIPTILDRIVNDIKKINSRKNRNENSYQHKNTLDDLYTRVMEEYPDGNYPSKAKFVGRFMLSQEPNGTVYLREPLGQFDMQYKGPNSDAEFNRAFKFIQDENGMRRAARGRNEEFEEMIDDWIPYDPRF